MSGAILSMSVVLTSSPRSPSPAASVPSGSSDSTYAQSSQKWQPSCSAHSVAAPTSPRLVWMNSSSPQPSTFARARGPIGSPAKITPL